MSFLTDLVTKHFTEAELKRLAIGSMIFGLVECSFIFTIFLYNPFWLFYFFLPKIVFYIVFLLIFSVFIYLVHELAHKAVAIHSGFLSEYQIYQEGAILSLLSIISPLKVVAPGVVMVYSSGVSRSQLALIALAGPISSLIIGGLFIALTPASMVLGISWVFITAGRASLDIALFNSLPFGPLDGAKVFRWNQGVWILLILLIGISWLVTVAMLFSTPI